MYIKWAYFVYQVVNGSVMGHLSCRCVYPFLFNFPLSSWIFLLHLYASFSLPGNFYVDTYVQYSVYITYKSGGTHKWYMSGPLLMWVLLHYLLPTTHIRVSPSYIFTNYCYLFFSTFVLFPFISRLQQLVGGLVKPFHELDFVIRKTL